MEQRDPRSLLWHVEHVEEAQIQTDDAGAGKGPIVILQTIYNTFR